MTDYREVVKTIEVPRNTGVQGFLHTIQEILKRPRVQNITVDARGKVTYKHYVREGEEDENFSVDFDFLQPYYIVRNATVSELSVPWAGNAAVVISMMFEAASVEQLHPVAFVSGANTFFWKWFERSTGVRLYSQDTVYGLPFLTDRHCDDSTLLLCAAFGNDSAFIDTQKSWRVVMDIAPPTTDVKIL